MTEDSRRIKGNILIETSATIIIIAIIILWVLFYMYFGKRSLPVAVVKGYRRE